MRIATIDIGTNSVLLLIAQTEGADGLLPVVERATITRLGQGVDHSRRLLPEAAERTLTCLASYADTLREHGVTHLAAVGTSAMRDAEGGQDFVQRAEQILGVAPRVIDGNEEARLTFAGALSGLPISGPVMVFDIGGGSTEVVLGELGAAGRKILAAVSLNIGSVRLFERHVHSDPPSAEELRNVEADIAHALQGAPELTAGAALVGVAGTVTQLAALELELPRYDGTRVHGSVLSRDSVDRMTAKLGATTLSERRKLPGMDPSRADVLVVGSAIARAVLHWSGARQLVVSDRGVRWGLCQELAAAAQRSTP